MSLHISGITNDTVGRRLKLLAGKLVNGWLTDAGTLLNDVHGESWREYRGASHTRDPAAGRPSEYPTNVLPAASRPDARFGAVRFTGQGSPLTPCVLPENSAR